MKVKFKSTVKKCLSFILNPNNLLRRRKGQGYAECRNKALCASNGQMALMMVLTTLMFLLIMVPVIEKFVQNEGKWSMKSRKTGLAFNLAEAGVDRAYWKLIENTDNWGTIELGGSIVGYANDKEYEDIDGGTYKINMSSGDNPQEIIIVGTGKDFSSKEYRAVKAVYSKEAIQAALQAPAIAGSGNGNIFWGPIMSLGNLELAGAANELYPRKYARGSITANGTYATRDDDINSIPNYGPKAAPYTEWWSYNEPPGVPDILTPDPSYYAALSQAQEAHTGLNLYTAGNWSVNNLQDDVCTVDLGLGDGPQAKVRFITGDVTFKGSKYFCGIVIALGEVTFNSGGKKPMGSISVVPPVDAWKEFQLNVVEHKGDKYSGDMSTWDFSCVDNTHPCSEPHGDTDKLDEYPGDGGYHTSTGCYNFYYGRDQDCDGDFTDDDDGDLGGLSTGSPLSFKGYVYAGTGFSAGATTSIFGAVSVATGGAFNGGGCSIFYDDMLDVKMLNDNITRTSWHEVTPVEF
jgi:hypothetical protein